MRCRAFLLLTPALLLVACGGSGGGGNQGGGGTNGGGTGGGNGLQFTDGSFTNNWQEVAVLTDSKATGNVNTVSSGGNPGYYFSITVTKTGSRGFAMFDRPDFTYDPSKQGAIDHLDFSEDTINLGAPSGQLAELLIVQNGHYYGQIASPITQSVWTTNSFTGLTPDVFYGFESNSVAITSSHPDFSATGAPMTFGFVRGMEGTLTSTTTGLDNFNLKIVPVKQ